MSYTRAVISSVVVVFTLSAAESKTPLLGTWSGTIGNYKIVACFQTQEDRYLNGSYYYLKYRQPIGLEVKNSHLWTESETCEWVFETITDSSAVGKWIDRKKNDTLPLQLEHEGTCEAEEGSSGRPCGCDLFNRRIEKLPALEEDTVSFSDGRCLRKFSMNSNNISMEWFELCGEGEIERKVNKELVRHYHDDNTDTENFFSCRRGALFAGSGWDFSAVTDLQLWNDSFLVVAESRNGYCGGAYPFSDILYRTFDLSTGEEIDLWSWFDVSDGEVSRKLNELILTCRAGDDELIDVCKEALYENGSYSICLDTAGIAFYTELARCIAACNQKFVVPFQNLMPFLSPEGKRKVTIMRGL